MPVNYMTDIIVANQGAIYVSTGGKIEAIRFSDNKVLWTALNGVLLAGVELD
jgi:hypothetical protein